MKKKDTGTVLKFRVTKNLYSFVLYKVIRFFQGCVVDIIYFTMCI